MECIKYYLANADIAYNMLKNQFMFILYMPQK